MEPTFVIGSIGSAGMEVTSHTKTEVLEYVRPVNFMGSFTTGNEQPQGEVMKLSIPSLSGAVPGPEPIFGQHLREAIAIVKDWHQRP